MLRLSDGYCRQSEVCLIRACVVMKYPQILRCSVVLGGSDSEPGSLALS